MNQEENHAPQHEQTMQKAMKNEQPYVKLLFMAVLSFISMYILMYAMVNTLGNVLNNFNQVYMAGLMTAPMMVFELLLMEKMYPNKNWNKIIIAVSIIAGLALFLFVQQQTMIGDQQFLRSMIPHHAGAITMCERATITDPEIQQLCVEIVEAQREEINQMKAIMERLAR